MGKGDQKTKKGKIFRNSYGVRRPRKKNQIKKKALEKNPQDNAPELKEKMTEIKVEEKEKKSGSSES
jgi:30S ribosomal protein S31